MNAHLKKIGYSLPLLFVVRRRMSSDVNVVSFAQCKLRVIRARTGSAIPF